MAFFHFNTLRKYTASLLNLFSNLETETRLSNDTLVYQKIPIQYSNRERSDIYNQLSYDQIFTGNTQVLPRGILNFNGMSPANDRMRGKFFKNYRKRIDQDTLNFQYTSVPYNFNFELLYQARGMNEASMIIEQVTSYFNPSYCMKVKEIDLPDFEKTNIIISLDSTDIQSTDLNDELAIQIVTVTFSLNLRGNIYPAIKDQEIIKKIQLFLSYDNEQNIATRKFARSDVIKRELNEQESNNTDTDEIRNDPDNSDDITDNNITSSDDSTVIDVDNLLTELELDDDEKSKYPQAKLLDTIEQIETEPIQQEPLEYKTEVQTFINQYNAAITDILYKDNKLFVELDNACEKLIKFEFDWFINDELQQVHSRELFVELKPNDVVKVRGYTDIVETNIFEKSFIIEEEVTSLKINDLIYDEKNNFLECDFTDTCKDYLKYEFEWFINGSKHIQKQRIIKFKSNTNFTACCVIKSSDNRTDKMYKNIKLEKFNTL